MVHLRKCGDSIQDLKHQFYKKSGKYVVGFCRYLAAKSCPVLCDPMDYSTPGFAVLHYLLNFAQTHVHWVNDAIQPSHPLSSSSPPTLNIFQHQGLYQWVSSLHQVAKILEFQHQSFQWILRVNFLEDWLVGSPCSPRDSQESSPAPQLESMHQFLRTQTSLWFNSHMHTSLPEKS